MTDDAASHMRAALALARRGLGTTWPNPSVGCVIVRDGVVVGRGRTASGGRPHAETEALAMAGVAAAHGATAYVTLEPCSHHAQTPPCADALIAAGIARVVVAMADPFPAVDGSGIARLRAAGIAVEVGLLADAAAEIVAGFTTRVRLGRPLVTLKLASTLDGRIATSTGQSRWITAPEARHAAHALRARHDAVMVGIGTALADDPDLRCRIPGLRTGQQPERIVIDRTLRLPPRAKLAQGGWVIHGPDADGAALPAARLIPVHNPHDPHAVLAALGAAGLTSVLVEGGASLAAALLQAGLVDRLAWFHAPAVMGGDGVPAVQTLGVAALDAMPRFRRLASRACGCDMLTEYIRTEAPCSPASSPA